MLLRFALQRGTPVLLTAAEVGAIAAAGGGGPTAAFGFQLTYPQKCLMDEIAGDAVRR